MSTDAARPDEAQTPLDLSTPLRVFGLVPDSIVDGPGLRYGVFVQGCSHGCPGCHNPESHDPHAGTLTTVGAVLSDIEGNGLIRDVTFSGGEPFEQAAPLVVLGRALKERGYGLWTYTGYLLEDLLRVARQAASAEVGPAESRAESADAGSAPVRPRGGDVGVAARGVGADIAIAPGEALRLQQDAAHPELLDPTAVRELLRLTDVLVEGPFVLKLRTLGLKWRGSSNQRLIDMAESRRRGETVLWEPCPFVPPIPESW